MAKIVKNQLEIDLTKSSHQKSTSSQSFEIDSTRLESTDSEHYYQVIFHSRKYHER